MTETKENLFFHGIPLPENPVQMAGYSYLIDHYNLIVPLPSKLSFIGHRHKRYQTDGWEVFTPRHSPKESIPGHLTFALRYEGVDLSILKSLFNIINPEIIARWIRTEPTGRYSRRIWFLYEWLMGIPLDVPDAIQGNYIDALDAELQYGTHRSITSRRHHVNNNMPGLPGFCPLVHCSERLDQLITHFQQFQETKDNDRLKGSFLDRLANFREATESSLMTQHTVQGRKDRDSSGSWTQQLRAFHKLPLSCEELMRLQSEALNDHRFVQLGLRAVDDYIGESDPLSGLPIPQYISPRQQDVPDLLKDLLESYHHAKTNGMPPLLLAAVITTGFILIRPFLDGNRRLYRYLIQFILEDFGVASSSFIFIQSGLFQDKLNQDLAPLKTFAAHALPLIDWQSEPEGRFQVTNETKDLYSYFDATQWVEYFYQCFWTIVEETLPKEIEALRKFDRLKEAISKKFNLPDPILHVLIRIMQENQGMLTKNDLQDDLAMLSEQECVDLECIYKKAC